MAIADHTTPTQVFKRWAGSGLDLIQLRDKRLPAGDLLRLAENWAHLLQGSSTRLLVNGRLDVALAAGAHGVHLTSADTELSALQVRSIFPGAFVSRSCHSLADVSRSLTEGCDLLLFGPVYEKRVAGELLTPGSGLALLRQACTLAGRTPVLALGGVTHANTPECLAAGAAGIAAIRLFQDLPAKDLPAK
ncbi:MAG: thiamine phosphate synthase [Acidobacteriaceae bacterium]|nr:thiamine phosphate synthase [Acidobacteriaceae bacterium]